MPEQSMPANVNPLRILWLEEPVPATVDDDPKELSFSLLCHLLDAFSDPIPIVRQRYNEVDAREDEPFLVPDLPAITRGMLRPLVEAKRCYVLGMPIPCIALSGLVGEMVAIWRFEMLQAEPGGLQLTAGAEAIMRNTPFENLGQEARVRELKALGDLDDREVLDAFGQLRGIRRQYLHFRMESADRADSHARQAFRFACRLVNRTLAMRFDQGRFVLPPRVRRYVDSIVTDDAAPSGSAGGDTGTENEQ